MYRRILGIHDGAFGSLIIIIFSYNFLTNKLILYIKMQLERDKMEAKAKADAVKAEAKAKAEAQ